jgi:hypothetical protein
MIWLTKDVSKRLNIPIKNVASHSDIQAKHYKESLDYWFGKYDDNQNITIKGYDAFQKLIRYTQTITRDGKEMDALTYAWRAWGDMDFILTIQAESQFKPQARGDIDNPSK